MLMLYGNYVTISFGNVTVHPIYGGNVVHLKHKIL